MNMVVLITALHDIYCTSGDKDIFILYLPHIILY